MSLRLLNFDEAVAVAESMPASVVVPGQHPAYVRNDSINHENVREIYQLYERDGKRWLHGFLSGEVPDTNFRDAFTVYGYGGPACDSADDTFLDEANAAADDWAREERVLAEFIRFHPVAENWRQYRGRTWPNRTTVRVDLGAEDLMASYRKRMRRDVRKGQRLGVEVSFPENESMVAPFIEMYRATMERNAADKFYFFPDEYVRGLFALGNGFVAAATVGEELVAVAVFLVFGEVLEYHLSAVTDAGMRTEANKVLLHEAFLKGRSLGARTSHLGGGLADSEDDPLFRFKAGFSTETCEFRIGDKIHFQKEYDALKEYAGVTSGRVLFWR